MAVRKGWKVKIADIGPPATVVQSGKMMAKPKLEGEQFWVETSLLEMIEKE